MHRERSKASIKSKALKLILRKVADASPYLHRQSTVKSHSASNDFSQTLVLPRISRLSLLPDFTASTHDFASVSPTGPKRVIKFSAPIAQFLLYETSSDNASFYGVPQAVKSVVSLADVPNAQVGSSQEDESCAQNAGNSSRALQLFGEIRDLTKDFLCSFSVVDKQLSGDPISVVSRDLLPKSPIPSGESLYVSNQLDTGDWTLKSSGTGKSISHFLILKQALFQREGSRHSHELFAQLDVTNLVENVRSDSSEEDVWLYTAAEEMEKLSIKNNMLLHHLSLPKSITVQSITESRMNIIRCFYQLFFVLCQPSSDSTLCAITHVSSSLLQHEAEYTSKVANAFRRDCFDIQKQLSRGERFFFDIREDMTGDRQLVCCVPMFGPNLNCWLCFLISGPVFERYLASCLES